MIYLNNNQVGHDTQTIGFPSVESCNAIVYQTEQALYGFHNLGGYADHQRATKAVAFGLYVQSLNIPHTEHATNLYSTIVGDKRYPVNHKTYWDQWADEMRQIAHNLDYDGVITLINLSSHIGTNSVYIRYDANNGDCDISFKQMAKMEMEMKGAKQDGMKEINLESSGNEDGKLVCHYKVVEPLELVKEVRFNSTSNGNLRPILGNAKVWTITRHEKPKKSGCCTLF